MLIDKDGVYQFAADFTGMLTVTAQNVKLVGADGTLENVLINVTATSANLFIQDLNITSSENKNVILFGSGTNTLNVAGENSLVSSAINSAVINAGGGLNIVGGGSLTASLTGGESYGAAIGSNGGQDLSSSAINIGDSVEINAKTENDGAGIGSGSNGKIGDITIGESAEVTATSKNGAGIGSGLGSSASVGTISIGGTANVTGASTNAEGIGAGSNASTGETKYGTDATVSVTSNGSRVAIEKTDVTVPDITSNGASEPSSPVYDWTAVTNNASTYQQLTTTAGYVVDDDGNSISYQGEVTTPQFTLTNIKDTEGITVEDGVVTLAKANLVDSPNTDTTVSITEEVEGGNYTLALAADVPKHEAPSTKITSENGTFNIDADGTSKSNPLQNVCIDLTYNPNVNLWIEDLYITSNEDKNIILFSTGTNYLTVKGTNSLVNTANSTDEDNLPEKALINVGDGFGLNILGDSTLTASITGQSYGAAIGTDKGAEFAGSSNINIGGSVTINATAVDGAGIGSGYRGGIGNITIGENANVTASSNRGAGIGAGFDYGTVGGSQVSVGEVTIGGNANVTASSTDGSGIGASAVEEGDTAKTVTTKYGTDATVNGAKGTDDSVTVAEIEPKDEPNDPVYAWTELDGNTSTYQRYNKTAGYAFNEGLKSIAYKDADVDNLFTLEGITSIEGLTVDTVTKTVTLAAAHLVETSTATDNIVTLTDGDDTEYTLALADGVTKHEAHSEAPITIENGTTEITSDGVYKFASNFTGDLTISAQNVKLIGADSTEPLSNVAINVTVADANLWIENLNITSNQNASLIKFGEVSEGGANTLTVKGSNTLINTADDDEHEQALINVGGGLNILGDGSLTARFTGSKSYGAAIGSDYQENSSADINIGGSVTITTESTSAEGLGLGAGIGSGGEGEIGTITIGGKANVTASSNDGAGNGGGNGGTVGNITIGGNAKVTASSNDNSAALVVGIGNGNGGSAGEITIGGKAIVNASSTDGAGIGTTANGSATVDDGITYGNGTTVTVNDELITEGKTDVTDTTPALNPTKEPTNPVYEWLTVTDGAATCTLYETTAGYVVDSGEKSISYKGDGKTEQFTLSGIRNTEGITIKDNVVTIAEASLDSKDITIANATGVDTNYTLALAPDVPTQGEAVGDPIMITSTNKTINADGIYQFAAGFTGTVTFGENAKNVKLIGAGSQLSQVYIDLNAVENANLWIEDLDIKSSEEKNVILFGSGTNTLTVAGENSLVNTKKSVGKAVINVGGGLNILGDSGSSLTASLTNVNATGAAIGTDEGGGSSETTINIGGSVTITANANGLGAGIGTGAGGKVGAITIGGNAKITASANDGAGIGSGTGGTVGDITIGGNAKVTASATYGAGIGKGAYSDSEVTPVYGTGTTINNDGITNVTKQDIGDPASALTAQPEPEGEPVYEWKAVDTDGKSSYKQITTTAGYTLDSTENKIIFHDVESADGAEALVTLSGIKNTDNITVDTSAKVVTLHAVNLDRNKTVSITYPADSEYKLALADDVTKYKDAADITTLENGTTSINADGVYKFAAGFSGTVTFGANAKNVKLIGAGSQLENVSIDLSAVENANLWIEDLDITSSETNNIILFGSGTNTLTVEGENSLVNTASDSNHNQALINAGGGLNILGEAR